MATAQKRPKLMTADEFLHWNGGDGTGRLYELVEGVIRAQDPASDAHGTIEVNIAILIGNYLRAKRPDCRVVANPGIRPHLRAKWNWRIPELGVTCTPNRADVHETPDPILLVEVLSPTNEEDTWSNISLYASVPSVAEILIVDSREVAAEVLRRGADGSWPKNPEPVPPGGVIRLTSIGLEMPMAEVYRGTHLG